LIYLKRLEDMIMGFWNGVAKAVGEGMIEAGNEHKALKMEYAEKSSEELHEIVKSDGFLKIPHGRKVRLETFAIT
ncbi:TPA: hypothetical protein ACFOTK_002089, partial [Neisseria meningitidis]